MIDAAAFERNDAMQYLLSSVGVLLFLFGCEVHMQVHPHAEYLTQAVGRDDHDAVAKKLGAPYRRVALDKGGDLWVYGSCHPGIADPLSTASSTGTVSTAPWYCQNLNLVFDKSGKLAEWHDK